MTTGVREGEIASLKWDNIYFEYGYIHVHSQQNLETDDNGKRIYYYTDSTKDEKGFSRGGRKIPLFDDTKEVLLALRAHQKTLGIRSEWVFCLKNGSWCTTSGYESALRRLTKGFALHNNHAFRMAFNSYTLVPSGMSAADRADILGHSPEVNERYYTFSMGDAYLAEKCAKVNAVIAKRLEKTDTRQNPESGTPGYPKIIEFKAKKKNPLNREFTGIL